MLSMDDLLEIHAKGDQSVGDTYSDDQPGVPPVDQRQYPDGIGLSGVANTYGHHILTPYPIPTANGASIAAGATAIYRAEDEPDFWIISVPTVANVALEVHVSNGRGAAPMAKLGGGGSCKVPGRGNYLTLVNYGSAASVPTVVGAAGWGEMATGDIEIYPGTLAMPS